MALTWCVPSTKDILQASTPSEGKFWNLFDYPKPPLNFPRFSSTCPDSFRHPSRASLLRFLEEVSLSFLFLFLCFFIREECIDLISFPSSKKLRNPSLKLSPHFFCIHVHSHLPNAHVISQSEFGFSPILPLLLFPGG